MREGCVCMCKKECACVQTGVHLCVMCQWSMCMHICRLQYEMCTCLHVVCKYMYVGFSMGCAYVGSMCGVHVCGMRYVCVCVCVHVFVHVCELECESCVQSGS